MNAHLMPRAAQTMASPPASVIEAVPV
jgi:hypothetical protein